MKTNGNTCSVKILAQVNGAKLGENSNPFDDDDSECSKLELSVEVPDDEEEDELSSCSVVDDDDNNGSSPGEMV